MMYNYCYQSNSERGSAIRFYNSQQINTVHCNQMDTCRLGVRFDASNIGNQGNAAAAQENAWYFPINPVGAYYAFWRDNTSVNPLWFVRTNISGIPYRPIGNQMNPFGFINYSFGSSTTDCEVPCPGCPNQRMAEIVQEQGDIANLSADEKYAAKKTVYEMLDADTTLMYVGLASDNVLQNFYDSTRYQSNLGMFGLVNNLMQDSLVVFAATVNDWIAPINLTEENTKSVNEIYLSTWGIGLYIFDNAQVQTLNDIALQNPIYGGDATYTARVMLGLDNVDFYTSTNRNAVQEIPKENFEEIVLELNPNPAKDFLLIENTHDGQIEFTIYNQLGNSVLTTKLDQGSNKIDISFLSSGFYCISYMASSILVRRNTLLIVK